MDMDRLLASVKKHEGYRNKVYLDTLEHDLSSAIKGANDLMAENGCMDMNEKAHEIIIEMVFQLGKTGVSKFRNMWKALSALDYSTAAEQMLDSRWAKQTPNRANGMADIMRSLG